MDTTVQTAIDKLYPVWMVRKYQTIPFPNQHGVVVAGIGKVVPGDARCKACEYDSSGKAVVMKYDSASQNWVELWSKDIISPGFSEFKDLLSEELKSQKKALAFVSMDIICSDTSFAVWFKEFSTVKKWAVMALRYSRNKCHPKLGLR
ncbi:hypothetical protein [Bacillus sp. EB600]|uniref:hypothetical protein n=1 Tax=Bacillus sp. EB600 TaxID=2806345 RepID=UPI00210D71DC|nr:hypothetical protein [Bacillus sp. EB600]MCQ6282166.1 hypothetical protein [Bacillus sp. EB600]